MINTEKRRDNSKREVINSYNHFKENLEKLSNELKKMFIKLDSNNKKEMKKQEKRFFIRI